METNAVSGSPASSGLMTAAYPLITPRRSSRRTRCCAADTDSPVRLASSVKLILPSRASSETIVRLISSTRTTVAAGATRVRTALRPADPPHGLSHRRFTLS